MNTTISLTTRIVVLTKTVKAKEQKEGEYSLWHDKELKQETKMIKTTELVRVENYSHIAVANTVAIIERVYLSEFPNSVAAFERNDSNASRFDSILSGTVADYSFEAVMFYCEADPFKILKRLYDDSVVTADRLKLISQNIATNKKASL